MTRRATFKGRVMRCTRVGATGAPVGGATGAAVSSGFIRVQSQAQLLEGEDWRQRLPDGTYNVDAEDLTQIERFNLVIDFCQVDTALWELIGAALPRLAAGVHVGHEILYRQTVPHYFALEVWARTTTAGTWAWQLWPFVTNGVTVGHVVENAGHTFTVNARAGTHRGGWGVGPYAVADYGSGPSALGSPVTGLFVEELTTVAPPSDVPGYVAVAL